MSGYSISTDKRRLQLPVIHDFLRESYWAKDIPESVVRRSVDGSLCFGVYHGREQIGFARVITDEATFAYLADVFILPAHRGKGLSRRLMEEIIAHPALQGLRRMLLATCDAHELYARFGFKGLGIPDRWMELHQPDIYR